MKSQKQLGDVGSPTWWASLVVTRRRFWRWQKFRISLQNQIDAMRRDKIPVVPSYLIAVRDARKSEARMDRATKSILIHHPISSWITSNPGVGFGNVANVLALVGPIDKFQNPAKLWKFFGMHVVDGRAPRREVGLGCGFSPFGRSLCYRIGESFVKGNGKYRKIYDAARLYYLKRPRMGLSLCPFNQVHKDKNGKILSCIRNGDSSRSASEPSESSGHVHAAARRFAVKRFLRDLWLEWNKQHDT